MQNLSISQSSHYRALFMNNLGNIQRENVPCSQIIPEIFSYIIKPLDSTSGWCNLEAASRIQGKTIIDYCFLLLFYFPFVPPLGYAKQHFITESGLNCSGKYPVHKVHSYEIPSYHWRPEIARLYVSFEIAAASYINVSLHD